MTSSVDSHADNHPGWRRTVALSGVGFAAALGIATIALSTSTPTPGTLPYGSTGATSHRDTSIVDQGDIGHRAPMTTPGSPVVTPSAPPGAFPTPAPTASPTHTPNNAPSSAPSSTPPSTHPVPSPSITPAALAAAVPTLIATVDQVRAVTVDLLGR